MAQMSNIIKAWVSVLKQSTTKQHRKRAKKCKKCNHAKYSKFVDIINDELRDVKGLVCGKCSCPLIAKIRSDDKCPIDKW